MPLYVYRCEACGREIEELQKMGIDDPPVVDEPCPEGVVGVVGRSLGCTMVKSITSAGFKFVGEGWGGWVETGPNTIQRNISGRKTSV